MKTEYKSKEMTMKALRNLPAVYWLLGTFAILVVVGITTS